MSWNFRKIDEALMAAAIDPTAWPKALECVASESGGRCSLLRPRLPGWEDSGGKGEENGRGMEVDGPAVFRPRSAGEQNSRFLAWTAEVRGEAGTVIWCLSIRRGEHRDPPFSAQEQRKLERLSRSLSRAAMIAQAVERASASAALEAFDLGNIAVILVNRAGDVAAVNKAAKRLLKAGIGIVDGRLSIHDPDSNAAIENAIRQLIAPEVDLSPLPPILIARRGRAPILAHPLRLANVGTNSAVEPLAAIILIDPSSRKKSSESNLHIAFRLTPAEAKLASALATGEPLDRICEQLEISKQTGRNQLKSIFAKTGTRRQAELVLVMAKML